MSTGQDSDCQRRAGIGRGQLLTDNCLLKRGRRLACRCPYALAIHGSTNQSSTYIAIGTTDIRTNMPRFAEFGLLLEFIFDSQEGTLIAIRNGVENTGST